MVDKDFDRVKPVVYDNDEVFIPRCPVCGRFVKPDESIITDIDGVPKANCPNATCSKDGRVQMFFIGFV